MNPVFGDLLEFISRLEGSSTSYRLSVVRPGALMVEVSVPGERWEVEFLESGHVEVERFRSDGRIFDGESLRELWPLLD